MDTKQKKWLLGSLAAVGGCLLILLAFFLFREFADYGFSREVSQEERNRRLEVVSAAENWLDVREGFAGHEELVRIYNSHEPLAQGYELTVDDSWCAAFVSVVAIQTENTHIIPTECGCERQIELFSALGRWVEDDGYVPLPGDLIYYSSSDLGIGDCTKWSDHVGIVVGTWGPFIKVIEGNYEDQVQYRIIPVDDINIRGYGIPDYESIA